MSTDERLDILEKQVEDLCKHVLKIQKNLMTLQISVITLQELALNDRKARRSSNGED